MGKTRSTGNVTVKGNRVARNNPKLGVFRRTVAGEWDNKVNLKFVLAGAGSYAVCKHGSFKVGKGWEGGENSIREEHDMSRERSLDVQNILCFEISRVMVQKMSLLLKTSGGGEIQQVDY